MVAKQTKSRRTSPRNPKTDPVERARTEVARGIGEATPALVALVAEWAALHDRINDTTRLDDDDADEFARYCDLQRAIYAFPASGIADLRAKLPAFRAEMEDAGKGIPPKKLTLAALAWIGLVADLERLAHSTAVPVAIPPDATSTMAEIGALDLDPVPELESWTPPTVSDLIETGETLRYAHAVIGKTKAELVAMIAAEPDATMGLAESLESARDWFEGLRALTDMAFNRMIVAGAAHLIAEGEAA